MIITEEFISTTDMANLKDKAVEWLNANVGPTKSNDFESGCRNIRRAQVALAYRLARGGDWKYLNTIVGVNKTIGEGWKVLMAETEGLVQEITIIIDDPTLAVQFKLAVM
jgi:hypothetical protein